MILYSTFLIYLLHLKDLFSGASSRNRTHIWELRRLLPYPLDHRRILKLYIHKVGARRETWTLTPFGTGFLDQRVYQFHHPGRMIFHIFKELLTFFRFVSMCIITQLFNLYNNFFTVAFNKFCLFLISALLLYELQIAGLCGFFQQ